jgi:hypothetical protein
MPLYVCIPNIPIFGLAEHILQKLAIDKLQLVVCSGHLMFICSIITRHYENNHY